MPCFSVDFETFYSSAYSLKKMGMDEYCADEQFDPYLVSIVGEGVEFVGHPAKAPWEQIQSGLWVSHNASFDKRVMLAAQKLGIAPKFQLPLWHCTADLVAYLQMPRDLKGAAKQLLKIELSKEARANMLDRRWADLNPQEREVMLAYALDDARYCLEIWERFNHKWPDLEKDLSLHAREAGIAGVHIDYNQLCDGIAKLEEVKRQAAARLPWDTSKNVVSPLALRAACKEAGIPAPVSTSEDDEDCARWEAQYGQQVSWIQDMRNWRKANRALRVLETMLRRTRPDGTMPFNLKYFGAGATGRWSGDAGLNMQNLPRAEMDGVNIRKCIVAGQGKTFVTCDLSQIEPRVLAWLCGDMEKLEMIAGGMDLYEAHARATMGYSDPRPLKDVDAHQRLLAKIRELGLGYGCGAKKFVQVAAIYGLEISEDEAFRIVADFRRQNPKIRAFWNKLQALLQKSVTKGDKTLQLELPSGRIITYFDLSGESGGRASTVKGQAPRYWYGGKLVENLVQATARDVFAAAYHRVLAAGYDVKWSVHDELIVEVPQAEALEAKANIQRLMSITPDWMEGLPVAAEATITDCYTK